jgi:hypothetical protein
VRYNEDNSTGNPPNTKMVIERYNIPAGTLTADPASAALVYGNEAIYETTHAGGQIHFDTVDDGLAVTKLYFAIPDNAYYLADCATKEHVQDDYDPAVPLTQVGKLYWVDVEQVSTQGPPPPPTVLAKGLRNPHSFCVDAGDGTGQGQGDVWLGSTGDLMTGDVFRWVAGTAGVLNYGWPWKEGDGTLTINDPHVLADTPDCPEVGVNSYTDPARVVRHWLTGDGHDALIGGYVYRGSGVLQDRYVFGTYGTSSNPEVFAIAANDPQGAVTVLTPQLGMDTWPVHTLHEFGQDTAGDLYIIRVDSGSSDPLNNGTIYKIVQ